MGTRGFFCATRGLRARLSQFVFVLVLNVASGGAWADEPDATTQDSIRQLLQASAQAGAAANKPSSLPAELESFYNARDFEPVWTGSDDALARAALVISTLQRATLQGLRSSTYVAPLAHWKKQPASGQEAAAYDIALTSALFTYASDVRIGRVSPGDVYKDVSLPDEQFDVAPAFAKALRKDGVARFLDDLPPIHPGYHFLANALVRYGVIASKGGWRKISARVVTKHNAKDAKRNALAKRLAFEDPVLAALPTPSAGDVQAALIRYQKRNALAASGKLDPETLKALNVPAGDRLREIVANMERWRWLPRELEHRYVEVDVPDQSVKFIEDGKVLLYSRVVVGMPTNPTPILRTDIRAIIANPPWDIPDDIAAKSLLPQLRRQPDYLAERNMVLAGGPADDPHGIKVDWKNVKGALPYQIQQSPGPDNVLGSLMLDMPNPFDVYLHDTANRDLFDLGQREKSHGCVRVQEIAALSSLALTDSVTDGADKISDAVASGETKRIGLDDPLAVYMLYWTAIAWPDGTVSFLPDLYHRDEPLVAKLVGAPTRR